MEFLTVLPVAADKREYDKAFLEELIEELQLGERLTHLPSELSGGEKQRVAIARALINRPRVLFADEPSGNLDSKTGIVVFDLLFRLSKKYNMTLVYVTHDINKAEMADRMIVMEDGKIK